MTNKVTPEDVLLAIYDGRSERWLVRTLGQACTPVLKKLLRTGILTQGRYKGCADWTVVTSWMPNTAAVLRGEKKSLTES